MTSRTTFNIYGLGVLGLTGLLAFHSPAAQGPTTGPAPDAPGGAPKAAAKDDTADWLLNQGTPAAAPKADESPSSRPTGAHAKEQANAQRDERRKAAGYRPGVIVTSDGEKIKGFLATTLDKPIRLWDDEKKQYRDLPFALVKRFDAKVLWERDEREWHFKESGSDVKEYSGKSYPARELVYTVTLANGQSVTGSVASPLYLDTPAGDKVFILHKRDKGEVGQTLKQLVYVKQVEFED